MVLSPFNPRLLFVLAFFFSLLVVQTASSQDAGAVPYTERASSHNRRYAVVVSGKWCDDLPCGIQQVRLEQGRHRAIWTKRIRNLSAMPAVSNRGDVAIATGMRVTMYGRSGKRKGAFKSREGFQNDLFEMFQAFSPGGTRYYVITGSPPDSLWFVALSDSGREIHREPLSVQHPCVKNAIRTYKERVIIFDCGANDDPEYERGCCVYNEDGSLIWEYDEQRQGRSRDKAWDVTFDERKGMLSIVDGEKTQRIKIDTLR